MTGYNFTDRVRNVFQMGREEAVRLQHEYVGTEHLLLALIRDDGGVAAAVLTNLGVEREAIRQNVEQILKKGTSTATAGAELPYTSRSKKVIELAMLEARELDHRHVGTEHLLLGLLREEKGIGAQVLVHCGVTRERAIAALGTVAHTADGAACRVFPMDFDDIVAWVKAHEEILSASFEEIGKLPMPFRKVIVRMVSEDKRLALWQEHLAVASAAHTTLTDEQRVFVAESAAALPEILTTKAVFDEWENRARRMLTPAQSYFIFETLGPPEPPGGLPLPPDAKPTVRA